MQRWLWCLVLLTLPTAGAYNDVVFQAPDTLDLRNAVIRLPPAPDASLAVGSGRIVAQDGLDGADLILQAPLIFVEGATLRAADGGRGGDAVAQGPGSQHARGGQGGEAGRVVLIGRVVGQAQFEPADGGDGGDAVARSDCEGRPGQGGEHRPEPVLLGDGATAEARGKQGGCGMPAGGRGGHAVAVGGQGGLSLDGTGGDGGFAEALAGRGGPGGDACLANIPTVESHGRPTAGNGGIGGNATAIGGRGGDGATIGGAGGPAFAASAGGAGGRGHVYQTRDDEWVDLRGTGGPAGVVNATAGGGGTGILGGGGGAAAGEAQGGTGGGACPDEGSPMQIPGVQAGALGAFLLLVARCGGTVWHRAGAPIPQAPKP